MHSILSCTCTVLRHFLSQVRKSSFFLGVSQQTLESSLFLDDLSSLWLAAYCSAICIPHTAAILPELGTVSSLSASVLVLLTTSLFQRFESHLHELSQLSHNRYQPLCSFRILVHTLLPVAVLREVQVAASKPLTFTTSFTSFQLIDTSTDSTSTNNPYFHLHVKPVRYQYCPNVW